MHKQAFRDRTCLVFYNIKDDLEFEELRIQWLLVFENNKTKNHSQIIFVLVIIQMCYCFSKAIPRDFHLASYSAYKMQDKLNIL